MERTSHQSSLQSLHLLKTRDERDHVMKTEMLTTSLSMIVCDMTTTVSLMSHAMGFVSNVRCSILAVLQGRPFPHLLALYMYIHMYIL